MQRHWGRLGSKGVVAVIISIIAVGAVIAASTLTHTFPAGPSVVSPTVHVTSNCSTLFQTIRSPGAFTNATGIFIQSGSPAAILYGCNSSHPPSSPALTITTENPSTPAWITPTISASLPGTLYVMTVGSIEACNTGFTSSATGAAIATGVSVKLAPGDYDYCLAIYSYSSTLQSFTVTWNWT